MAQKLQYTTGKLLAKLNGHNYYVIDQHYIAGKQIEECVANSCLVDSVKELKRKLRSLTLKVIGFTSMQYFVLVN